jgi:uncharacterized protein (DUF2235 family)
MADASHNTESLGEGANNQLVEPKRLILCLDGTWNQADDKQITNIVRIRDLIEPKVNQRVYYHNGVGTGLSKTSNLVDGATGRGLGRNVRGIYRFLSQHYSDGIELYIFGFSRGAFTARSLVGYIGASGLLKPEHCSSESAPVFRAERSFGCYRASSAGGSG